MGENAHRGSPHGNFWYNWVIAGSRTLFGDLMFYDFTGGEGLQRPETAAYGIDSITRLQVHYLSPSWCNRIQYYVGEELPLVRGGPARHCS
jgi:hypothetical protein